MKPFTILFKVQLLFSLVFFSCEKDPSPNMPENTDDSASYTVSTFAGNGTNGIDPATGGPALFNFPADIAFDAAGNLYVADFYNDKIRKITSSGVMTTFAGSSTGYADGKATEAMFYHPSSIACDDKGNIFVAEAGNLRIRKINTAGIVSTIAGDGTAGIKNGMGIAAQINDPAGMITDSKGNIFFLQSGFHGIRKISPDGMVSTFAGSAISGYTEGIGTEARFNQIYSLEMDAQENIYVADFKNYRIRKITPKGFVSTFIKIEDEKELYNFTMDTRGNNYATQGNIDITEIVKINPTGKITKIAGGPVGYMDGRGNTAQFAYITGFKVASNGDIYLAELHNNKVRIIKKN